MKAILKANRKVIVDVEHIPYFQSYSRKIGNSYTYHYYDAYREKNKDTFYRKDELDFVEYYGG